MITKDDIKKAASDAHEANRLLCVALGDESQTTWNNAPQWQRDSCIKGVENVVENPELTPKASHDSWLKCKQSDGWSYGKVKDPEKKEHPCMVPYESLPKHQQAKDHLFIHVVKTSLGLQGQDRG